VRQVVTTAIAVMDEVERFLREQGMREHTAPVFAFTCGLKVGRLECARTALREHEEKSERARGAAKKKARRAR
jgi:hypothetical protein